MFADGTWFLSLRFLSDDVVGGQDSGLTVRRSWFDAFLCGVYMFPPVLLGSLRVLWYCLCRPCDELAPCPGWTLPGVSWERLQVRLLSGRRWLDECSSVHHFGLKRKGGGHLSLGQGLNRVLLDFRRNSSLLLLETGSGQKTLSPSSPGVPAGPLAGFTKFR